MTYLNAVLKIILATALVGVLCALAMAPVAGLGGVAVARTNETMQSDIQDLEAGNAPGVTTIKDSAGGDIAYLYTQRRYPVESTEIAQSMKDAIVSIEDRRFYEHDGVDIQGNFRAVATNLLHGGVSQGASTLDQQYVKNYLLLVNATSEEEQQAATEQSVARKLREMRMATQIDRTLEKDEILTNYLNLVPFGNHAYGIEAAARTYFGVHASELTLPQSAMLAGMVQSSEYLNPYTNYEGALERRNVVLQSLASNGYISQEEADEAAGTDLGVLEEPATLPNGCITAGDRGFFCDYVTSYLENKGLSMEELARGGYTITTTLDPAVQDEAKAAVTAQTPPTADGVAEVMSVIRPGENDRGVLAMVSSRTYGLDQANYETILPQPYSLVGNGAGSVFKIFTAAAALSAGYGIKDQMAVPARYEATGLGHGGAANCPANKYCVENAGSYKTTMTLEDTLAYSPNTSFVELLEQVGVPAVVDMSVKLGLRSYTEDDTFSEDTSIAQAAKDANMGSFTLGPTAVNPLELSNVGATIASGGRWCEPNPISSVSDHNGNEVYIDVPECEQALNKDVANALSNALTQDSVKGTAADAARAMGFGSRVSAKTGTTESNQSSAFLGFNSGLAAAPYIYNDGTTTSPLCTSPVRQCGSGNLFGGLEPARTFFSLASQASEFADGEVPGYDTKYDTGTTGSEVLDGLKGKSESEARSTLEKEGYIVKVTQVPGYGTASGRVVRALLPAGGLSKGAEVTVQLSDGTGYTAPTTSGYGYGADGTTGDMGGAPGQVPAQNNNAPAPADPNAELQQQFNDLANQFRDALGL
ncbi:transglycosylase domain-containing protein [uncultured Corynebacterium sp.]|uniref:transglycosylase domain-containing protein n=1 Tax=uncultured Corynebacterium sp. TaxID=159447 RepID=UPI0025F580D1|nr:transglycosylase domain-containing protein [uncultured Corynebacterium sp.]